MGKQRGSRGEHRASMRGPKASGGKKLAFGGVIIY